MVASNPNEDAILDKNLTQDKYINDLSEPNALFKYASVNYIFTLSCLSEADLTNTKTLLNSVPHDILIRSGGVGENNNSSVEKGYMPTADKIEKAMLNKRGFRTTERVKSVFDNPRDLYFKSVNIQSVPKHNQNRPLTSVTSIDMEITEPWGISLLDRLRAGAANNGYFDHLDSPYLLTIEFAGFDEVGKQPYDRTELKNLKRVIPVKLVDMNLDVNQAGSVYSLKAIPYNEFGYSNVYLYPRTSGSVQGNKLSEACKSITEILNNQNLDEKAQGLVELPDIYSITVDSEFEDTPFEFTNIKSTGMNKQYEDQIIKKAREKVENKTTLPGTSNKIDYDKEKYSQGLNYKQIVKFTSKNSLLKVLEEMCKASPEFGEKELTKWESKVKRRLKQVQRTKGNQGVYDASQEAEMYFKSYQIKTTITPMSGHQNWDGIRMTHRKKVNFHITPHYIHAYSLAIPGVSTGTAFAQFIHKTYNYIFTGENVDVLNLDINYRLAYFQSRLKNVEGDSRQPAYRVTESGVEGRSWAGDDPFEDAPFLVKSETQITKSNEAGVTGEKFAYLDQLQDELSNPLADMINVSMDILGDPAWISQSQFIPMNLFESKGGTAERKDVDYWQGGVNHVWNDKWKCYNFDVADPLIMLNFKMPTDANDKKGTYELADGQSTTFTGIYRVVGVTHSFDQGSFTQTLNMVRIKNQGVKISNANLQKMKVTTYTSGESVISNSSGAADAIANFRKTAFEVKSVANLFGRFTSFTNNIKNKVTAKVKSTVKGFFNV